MILYLDTSALVKFYVEEDGSDKLRELAGRSEAMVVSWIAYVEARSAFARRYRQGQVPLQDYRQKLSDFENDWPSYSAMDVSHEVVREAGELVAKHGLRALDAIHLASALSLKSEPAPAADSVVFSSADTRLMQAAEAEGFGIAPLI